MRDFPHDCGTVDTYDFVKPLNLLCAFARKTNVQRNVISAWPLPVLRPHLPPPTPPENPSISVPRISSKSLDLPLTVLSTGVQRGESWDGRRRHSVYFSNQTPSSFYLELMKQTAFQFIRRKALHSISCSAQEQTSQCYA